MTLAADDMAASKRALLDRWLQGEGRGRAARGIERRGDPCAPAPLSFAQQRLWFLDQLEAGSAFYNVPSALRLSGRLDVAALENAIDQVVRRHDVLRTVFRLRGDAAEQVILPQLAIALPVEDVSALPPAQRDAACARHIDAHANKPFDLAAGPLVRATLVRRAVDEHVLLLVLHHIVCDGWAVDVLVRELGALYAANVQGLASPLPELPLQYADFAQWQRARLHGETLESQLAYWRQRLDGAPAQLDLPADRPRPAAQSYRGGVVDFVLPAALGARLDALAREAGATRFMTLAAAFSVLLYRCSGQADICLGTPIANRTRAELEPLIGCFVNTLVLRTGCAGNPTFRALLQSVRRHALDAYAHQDLPFERLVESLQGQRSLACSPLFQIMFALQNTVQEPPPLPGLAVEPVALGERTAKFDLSLDMWEQGGALRGRLEYASDLFERDTVVRLAGHFETLLDAIAADPAAPIDTLPLLSPEERRRILVEWSRSPLTPTLSPEVGGEGAGSLPLPLAGEGRGEGLQSTYAELFAPQAARDPDRVVAACEGEHLSFGELDRRAEALAHALIEAGAGRDTLVALLAERGLPLLVMMVAVLKAGAAFLPLDVKHPAARLREVLRLSRAPLVLSSLQAAELGQEIGAAPLVAEALWLGNGRVDPPVRGTPDDLAYVIFTSGSTGVPKGALIEQRGMLNNMLGKVPTLGLNAFDRIAQTASLSFDVCIWQLLAAPLVGATVHIVPDEIARDPRALLDCVEAERLTLLEVVPSLMRAMLDEASPHTLASLRWLLPTGEALAPELARDWLMRFPHVPLMNLYGPAECSDDVACHALTAAAPVVPIGRPTPNNALFVLDARLQPVPVGVTGEICIAGAGVGRGYLHDDAATAAAFVAHPFAAGQRLYRSGDLGRWRADGTLEFLGRRDAQIKLRGQRIEPGEIESQLRRHPGVRDAAVAVHDERLVAYWHGAAEAHDLRKHLATHLPPHMLPSDFMALDTLPRNANGKLDRKALPRPDRAAHAPGHVAPHGMVETALAAIWAEALGLERVGAGDDFFALGGHSLLATRVASRIRARFAVELPLRTLFESPTLAALARRIEAAEGAGLPAIVAVARGGALPLSFAQARLWFLDRLSPGHALYNMPAALRITGRLDPAALERALNEIVRRHEILRTTYREVDGVPVQVVAPDAQLALRVQDLSDLPAAARSAQARAAIDAEARRPFDLGVELPIRAGLLRLGAAEHIALITLHHIAADEWSEQVLMRELGVLYDTFARGLPSPLPAPALQYADFAHWQRQWLQGDTFERQLAYWTRQLDGAPALLALPTDRPRPARQTDAGASVPLALSAAASQGLRTLARDAQATLFMTLMAAFQLLLHRHTGQDDLCVGTPVANRHHPGVEGLIGLFVNTLVLRARVDAHAPFGSLLAQVKEATLAACAHQDVPFEAVVDALRPERSLSHTPLFQAMFVLQDDAAGAALPGLSLAPVEVGSAVTRFDLVLQMRQDGKRLSGRFDFSTDLFDRGTIERMARHFETLAESIVARPGWCAGELPLLVEGEREWLLRAWNRTGVGGAGAPTIPQRFEAAAARHAGRPAVVFENVELSYAQLNTRANQLAHDLRRRGVGPEVLVGLCVERSLDMIVGVLGILKAGGAYLPLDPVLPEARLAALVEDAKPHLLLTQTPLLARLPAQGRPALCLDDGADLLRAQPRHNLACEVRPDNLAYVIYTSGSTGKPKGVEVRHRGVCNLARNQAAAFGIQAGQRVLQLISLGFDASVLEIFMALEAGATLVLAPREALTPGPALQATLVEQRIDVLTVTPSALSVLSADALPHLKTVIVGGERFERALIDAWSRRCAVFNAYGPTEASVCVSSYRCGADDVRDPPIGRPAGNTQFYILDTFHHPVPIGVAGELHVAGEGLARGYANRPDLTAECFIPDPFGTSRGARMYKTGDLARWRPDGNVEFLGRTDEQVKVRGYRIEIGEIEARLCALPPVREAVVLARTAGSGHKHLVAYLVPKGATIELAHVRAELARQLPEYMIPAHFVALEHLPCNSTGKVDRKALPPPTLADDAPHEPAATPTELRLAELWAELLERPRIGRQDHFFHVGGHSLLAVQLVARIEKAFGIALPLSQLFVSPTLTALAQDIDARGAGAKAASRLVVPLQTQGDAAPLFLLHPSGGTIFCYLPLAQALGAERPCHAVQSPEIAGWDAAPQDFDALCRLYAREIECVHPAGPIVLGGWSMGGALALRVGNLLEAAGRHIEWIALFDAVLVPEDDDDEAIDFAVFIDWALTLQTAVLGAQGAFADSHERARRFARTHGSARLAERMQDEPAALACECGIDADYQAFFRRQFEIQAAHEALSKGITLAALNAPLHVFWARETTRREDWFALTARPRESSEQTLPGRHDDVMVREGNAQAIALALRRPLSRLRERAGVRGGRQEQTENL